MKKPAVSTLLEETRLPVNGETLWTTTVLPSLKGSGALPEPVFTENPASELPMPAIDALIEAFSTPVDLNRIVGTFP